VFFVGIDTALVNTGLVILDEAGVPVYSGKPFPKKEWKGDSDSFFWQYRRIAYCRDWIQDTLFDNLHTDQYFIAIEDYLLTGYATSYKTAELISIIKDWCHEEKIRYCLVHPAKTKKYVIKKKKVSKTEMIAHAKESCPTVFEGIDRADYGDIADAYAIAKVGQLVYEAMRHDDPEDYVRRCIWPERWKEMLLGQTKPTGIITKPGLTQWSYETTQ